MLVLGDLGLYESKRLQGTWAHLGEALGRRGVRAAALLPCPAVRWGSPVVDSDCWQVIDWSNPARRHPVVDNLDARRDRLLALLAWTVVLEPALLRDVRALLPASEADIGTEADVWNHAGATRHIRGLVISEPLRHERQQQLRRMMADDAWTTTIRRVVAEVRRHHASLAKEVWHEEVRILDSIAGGWVDDGERDRSLAFTRKLRTFLAGDSASEGGDGRSGSATEIRSWANRSIRTRVPADAWNHETWGPEFKATYAALHPTRSDAEMPIGLKVGEIPYSGEIPLRTWMIRQVGAQLHIAAAPRESGIFSPGSPLTIVQARKPWLSVGRHRRYLDIEQPRIARVTPLPPGGSVVLGTDCMEVTLRLAGMPDWAYAAGRDDYGLWAAFRVEEVVQRMRWIPPGRFTMGSPETEVGRRDDETQHEVILEDGFWLAETPCTQELWQAVMETNPSFFKSPKRPVESVSWHDAREFIEQLNERIENLHVELPTEEQWEYACRAGTTTATYAGDLDLLGANHARVLHAIAWYGGNSGVEFDLDNGVDSSNWPEKQFQHTRAGTREVGQKQRNPWGLYDMLGNVDEWCADERHGLRRVFRGGGWFGVARFVRAAFRVAGGPGLRFHVRGFRLARGQGNAPGKPVEKPAEKEDARAEEARAGDPPGAARRAREQEE